MKDYVDVDYFLSCCKVCQNYGHVWACPPYDFDPRDLWRKYDRLHVYGYQVRYSGERTQKEMEEVLWQVKERLRLTHIQRICIMAFVNSIIPMRRNVLK